MQPYHSPHYYAFQRARVSDVPFLSFESLDVNVTGRQKTCEGRSSYDWQSVSGASVADSLVGNVSVAAINKK